MNNRIYKYPFHEVMELPKGAKVLTIKHLISVDSVTGQWYIYVLVDPENELEKRVFQAVETGCKLIDNNLLVKPTYITTTVSHNDKYILHLFENIKI